MRPPLRVTIIPPILEDEPFFSVRLYAANLVPALVEKGIEVDQLEFSRRFQRWLPARINGPVNRYLLHPLYAAARQGRINHILDHAYSHLAFTLDPRRTIVSCNSMSIPKAINGEIPGFAVSRALRASMWLRHAAMLRCARIVACSHALKNDIIRFFGCDPEKVSVVHDGINHSVFKRLQDRTSIDATIRDYTLPTDGTRLILVVSTAGGGGYKNRMGALKTQQALVNRGIKSLMLLVGGALTGEEQVFANQHRLGASVRSLGRISWDALVALYNLTDVFLFPSWDEGFGYPPIEAMACGAPVVVSKIPVLLETTGGAALAAAPDDAEGMADQVQRILTDDDVANRLRADGQKQAQRYSWTRYADEIIEVYRDIAAAPQ
jgi:glycosyltransferase involved in cell wall biosynthesis